MKDFLRIGICSIIGSLLISNSAWATEELIGYDMSTGLPVTPKSQVTANPLNESWGQAPLESSLEKSKPASNSTSFFQKAYQTEVGDGFAIGAQLGIASAMSSEEFPYGIGNETRGLKLGAVGGLHLSYGYSFVNQFYLGAEVYGNLENTNYVDRDQDPKTYLKVGNNVGAVILPGFHIDSTNLIYAKLGANYGKVSFYTTDSSSPWKIGSDIGLGFRQILNENLSLGLEYDWIKYIGKQTASNVLNISGNTTSEMSQYFYLLSLDYQLGKASTKTERAPKNLQLNGPYAGFNVGAMSQNFKDDWVRVDPGTPGEDLFAANGYFETLKLGYSHSMNSWFYLAAEAFARMAQQVGPEQYSADFNKQKASYGVSLLPGYIINLNNLLFTRVSYLYTQFSGIDQGQGGNGTPYNSTRGGYQVGVGYEAALRPQLSLVVEYDYEAYPRFKEGPSPYGIIDNYTITNNLMSIGLNYRF